ncbi:MAG: hypothetical protein HRT61_01925 [Ekhidna sp.]|nr:hypothetical protein [Ekhidna sp.]
MRIVTILMTLLFLIPTVGISGNMSISEGNEELRMEVLLLSIQESNSRRKPKETVETVSLEPHQIIFNEPDYTPYIRIIDRHIWVQSLLL